MECFILFCSKKATKTKILLCHYFILFYLEKKTNLFENNFFHILHYHMKCIYA